MLRSEEPVFSIVTLTPAYSKPRFGALLVVSL